MTEGVIFDVDGTLLDSMGMWKRLDIDFLASVNITPDPGYTDIVNKMTLREGVHFTKTTFQLEMTEEEILETIREMAMRFYYHEARLKPFAKDFLEKLSQRKIPMSVATSSQKDFILSALKRNGADRFFNEIFSGSDLGVNKNRPDLYLMAADSIGAAPENCWVFEDSYHALFTAKKAGFRTVAVYDDSNAALLEETVKEADLYMEDLRDFDLFLKTAGI